MVQETSVFRERFVELIKLNKEILTKVQQPEIRKKKQLAVAAVRNQLEKEFKISMTNSQVFKKISNLKSRVKQKTDLKHTGNKSLVLKGWEQEFLDLLQAESTSTVTGKKYAVLLIHLFNIVESIYKDIYICGEVYCLS